MKRIPLLETEFGAQLQSNGWYRMDNPFDDRSRMLHDKAMSVNPETGIVKCWRTGYTTNINAFLQRYFGNRQYKVYTYNVERPEKEYSEVLLPDVYPLDSLYLYCRIARQQLQKRGFDIDYLNYKGFGVVKESDSKRFINRLFIPFYRGGKLVFYQVRALTHLQTPKYLNVPEEVAGIAAGQIFYNEDALDGQTAYLVEGWACAETIGDDAAAYLGAELSDWQMNRAMTCKAKRLIIVPDVGIDSRIKQQAATLSLHKEVVLIDLNKVAGRGKDVNEIGFETLKQLVDEAKTYDLFAN